MIRHQEMNSKSNYNYNAYTYFNTDFSPHFHGNYGLIYVLGGELRITVSGRTEKIEEGQCALVLAHQVHTFESLGNSHIWIGVFSQQFVPHFASKTKDLEGNSSVFTLDSVTDALVRDKLVYSDCSVMMKKACLYAVCDRYLDTVTLEKRKSKNDELICQMLRYVEEHFKENITLTDLADHFGYEYHYLSRLLNNGYSINFSDTVNRYRVEHAVMLLEETDKSMTEVALESGFRSIRSFNHIFKSVMGRSPSELAK